MIRSVRAAAAAFLLVLGAIGCGDEGSPTQVETPDDTGGAVSFSSDIQPIFTTRCATAGCHQGPAPAGGLTLEDGLSFDALVDVESPTYNDPSLRVDPSNASGSLLLLKVQDASGVGDRMPIGGNLSSAEITLIETWISEGAGDN